MGSLYYFKNCFSSNLKWARNGQQNMIPFMRKSGLNLTITVGLHQRRIRVAKGMKSRLIFWNLQLLVLLWFEKHRRVSGSRCLMKKVIFDNFIIWWYCVDFLWNLSLSENKQNFYRHAIWNNKETDSTWLIGKFNQLPYDSQLEPIKAFVHSFVACTVWLYRLCIVIYHRYTERTSTISNLVLIYDGNR